jgi:hypothetical protein
LALDGDGQEKIRKLAALSPLAYQQQRETAATKLGIRVTALDSLVTKQRAEANREAEALPHWNVEPWDTEVPGAKLLEDIERVFRRYIVLPEGAGAAMALWTLHAWTMNAGDISPFLVLVSPTKRCGKTSALIVLNYLTPRSVLASNISASALFRYVEEVRPTLLIDEGDSFIKDNEPDGDAAAGAEATADASRPGRERHGAVTHIIDVAASSASATSLRVDPPALYRRVASGPPPSASGLPVPQDCPVTNGP